MKLKVKHKGSFRGTERMLNHFKRMNIRVILMKYGQIGVESLMAATPKLTGESANSWYYEIEERDGHFTLSWNNSNLADGTPIVVLLQYGHGTIGGTFVQGQDFINPALQPIVNRLSEEIWKEVTNG